MYKKFFKRFLDIVISLLGLIILSPVIIIVAILVRIKIGTPVIFKQERPGKNEKIFKLYKFRSMSNKKDENGKLLPDSERLTKFGKILRATSLDEIPELINILKGEMSLIGPRPLSVMYLPYYNETEKHRHDVRPGLTGLAQINGRNVINWEERFQYDLEYINNITFINDLKILFKTFYKVVKEEDIVVRGEGTVIDFDEYRQNQINQNNAKECLMNKKKRVLVLSCGALTATDMNVSLKDDEEFEIWGTSIYKDHGIYVYKNYIPDIPKMSEPNFIEILNKKIKEYDIKYLIPTHEDMCVFLQENKDKINAITVCSDYETSILCRYKTKTYEKMKNYDFVPKTYKKEDVKQYPVFCKKDTDQGARHAYKVNNYQELDTFTQDPDMIICEYLSGDEATVDCFTNKNRELVFCNPRATDRMLAGIDVHARRLKLDDEIKYIAESLNKEINFRGCWFFQIKKDINGKYKLLEIATRLPGAFSLSRCLDFNLLQMSLKDIEGQDIEVTFNDINIEADKQFFGKYTLGFEYKSVYIDFESCFEKIEKINSFVMMYLYQCINKNIPLNLLVNNKEKTVEYLKKNKIDINLFDKIIETERNNIKNILEKNSILLSNDYKLKNEIRKNNKNYYCFASSIIESLIDWKA